MLSGEGVLVPTFKCQMWIYIVHSGKKTSIALKTSNAFVHVETSGVVLFE